MFLYICKLPQNLDKTFPNLKLHVHTIKAALQGKLKGAQCSETVKSSVPSIGFV